MSKVVVDIKVIVYGNSKTKQEMGVTMTLKHPQSIYYALLLKKAMAAMKNSDDIESAKKALGIDNFKAAQEMAMDLRDEAYSRLGLSIGYGPDGVFGHTETKTWKIERIEELA